MSEYYTTSSGRMVLADSKKYLSEALPLASVDLIITSPPFGLVRKKDYGNVDSHDYIDWFRPFGNAMKRVLAPQGSLVIDIGGSWIEGQPTRSLYHFKLLVMLCEELGFHLAQEFYWWNPSKLPTPAEWVTVRRIRVKDAVNCVWWLSSTPYPKASNKRVLQPYSESMRDLLRNGYTPKKRPSGHDISRKFGNDNKAAIPPNLIAIANTESNSQYLNYCAQNGIKPHPARFPSELPEFFVRMLTEPGDLVVDPFAGSCVSGEVAERLGRRWICIDNEEEYLRGALGRFGFLGGEPKPGKDSDSGRKRTYKIARPGLLWDKLEEDPLPEDGGRSRRKIRKPRFKKDLAPNDDKRGKRKESDPLQKRLFDRGT